MRASGKRTSAESAEGARGTKRVLHLFEPRWHGYAHWRIEDGYPMGDPDPGSVFVIHEVERGWVRRPRGAPYMRFDLAPEMANLGEPWTELVASAASAPGTGADQKDGDHR